MYRITNFSGSYTKINFLEMSLFIISLGLHFIQILNNFNLYLDKILHTRIETYKLIQFN